MATALTREQLKKQAAHVAAHEARSGMVLGLGTGSTAAYAIEALAESFRTGELTGIVGIPTSQRTARQARSLGLPLGTLAKHPRVDLAIDGADEVDPQLDLIKGLGGALWREKEVEKAAARFIVVVDESKLVARLGTRAPVPVEVAADHATSLLRYLASLDCRPVLRPGDEGPFITDSGNVIIDCHFSGGLAEPAKLARELDRAPHVLAHGLFLGMAHEVVVASVTGVRTLKRSQTS